MAISIQAMAQTKYLNQVKYWDYRYNFKQDFIDIGAGIGQSLPFEFRGVYESDSTYRQGSIIDLGWHMAVLSTEYYISSKRM